MFTRESYATLRAGRQPNWLVVDALDLLEPRDGRALDIGAGPLNDTLFLLRAGLSVDAVDKDPHILVLASALNDPRLNIVHADIREIPIARATYSLIVAIHVLPFLPRADLRRIISTVVDGLSKGGILCCTFLGLEDGWAHQRPRMTFLSRSEVASLFARLQPMLFSERKYDGRNAKGEPKRWHVLRCIFRK